MVAVAFTLTGCAALDYKGDCYFAEQPAQYLRNAQGQYIDLDGRVVSQPVSNPYYVQYRQCYPTPPVEQLISDNAVRALLKDSYRINNMTYQLAAPRKIERQGAYIESLYKATTKVSYLNQEIFNYAGDRAAFPQRFLNDINRDEGQFESKTSNGQPYIIGKNNAGGYVIYVVKNVLDQRIEILQFNEDKPFNPQDIAVIVKDLHQI